MTVLILLTLFWGVSDANEHGCRFSRLILTTGFSILEDPDRSLTIEEVNGPQLSKRFHPNSDGRTNFGISRSAYWFQIEPELPPDCRDGWLLALPWPMLDSIDFFWRENDTWQHISTGARHPYASRQIDFHNFMFRFPDLSTAQPPYFLRVAGDNPLFMEMRLLQTKRFISRSHRRLLLQGIFIGILLGLILYNVFVFLSLRDTAYLYYLIYLVSTTLLVAQYNGITTRYLWPDSPEWNVRALWSFALSGTTAYLAFVRKFLETKDFSPKIDRLFQGYVIGLLLTLVALYVSDQALSIGIPPFLAVIGMTLATFAIAKALHCHSRPKQFVCVANFLFGVGIIWVSALTLGYPQTASDGFHFVFEACLTLEAILLSLALASRIKLLHQDHLSTQLALLESRHQFANRLIAAQDAEHKRVASELHDGIGQNLMVIKNRLNRLLKAGLPSHLAKPINFAAHVTQTTICDLRGLAHRLHPHELDRLGLTVATEAMAKNTLNDAGIHVNCQIDAIDHLLDRDRSLHLYRIVQEALRNIVTHAEADRVKIRLAASGNKKIRLHIEDNGTGIHTSWFERNDFSRAFGLSSICERVQLMGGRLWIRNGHPRGLTLDISISV